MAFTTVANGIVPRVFSPWLQKLTEAKSRLVQSGAVQRDPMLDELLAGRGLTLDIPIWNDLANTAANVSTDAADSQATVQNIDSHQQIAVRLSRNQVWGSADLVQALSGDDVMGRIAERISPYWMRHLQATVLATLSGVFKDNDDNDDGDYTVDISGSAYQKGVTDFSADAFIDAAHTMGDSEEDLGIVLMHEKVYARAKKNNLIDFVQDSQNPAAQRIPTFLGRQVLVDDGMPESSNVFETFILGAGAIRIGSGQPRVPLATDREELEADGGGREYIISRVEWAVHPDGHAYTGTAPNGGPGNGTGSNHLDNAGSWDRRVSERKQVKIARLITREA